MGKSIYTLTNLRSDWHIHRYDEEADHIYTVETHIASRSEAIKRAMLEAERNRPSEVLVIAASGVRSQVAAFN